MALSLTIADILARREGIFLRQNNGRNLAMKTNAFPQVTDEIRSYAQLQRHIHDALRVEHPE
jgi:hypothetical protein